MHSKYTVGNADLSWVFGPRLPTLPQTRTQGEDGAFGKGWKLGRVSSFPWCPQLSRSGFLPSSTVSASCNCWPRAKGPFSMLSFLLGPSMVVRIVLVLILSTSFVIQKNAQNTLRTSEHSSASSVTRTSNTRIPNTTGYHTSIRTVSRRSLSFLLCGWGLRVCKPCQHRSLGLWGLTR